MEADCVKGLWNVEIANLKAQLSLKEAEAAEAIRLRGQVVPVEDMDRYRRLRMMYEFDVMELRCFSLGEKEYFGGCSCYMRRTPRSDIWFMRTFPRNSYAAVHDEQGQLVAVMVMAAGPRLVVMNCLLSPEYLAALGEVIGPASINWEAHDYQQYLAVPFWRTPVKKAERDIIHAV
ncbi:hypothetical protein Tco_0682279 [Tanacetum coccineum]|uniref:Uncharacterized protein n=1 Tax=Tanacetum coccineum TaxID=301880 RepID=A0ABQ4XQP9_9ASTR